MCISNMLYIWHVPCTHNPFLPFIILIGRLAEKPLRNIASVYDCFYSYTIYLLHFQTFIESPASSTFFDLMLKAVKGNGKRFSLVGDMEIDDEINRFRDMNTDVNINPFINEIEL